MVKPGDFIPVELLKGKTTDHKTKKKSESDLFRRITDYDTEFIRERERNGAYLIYYIDTIPVNELPKDFSKLTASDFYRLK